MQVRAPMPPSYMFVIDVSVAAVACGMLTAVVDGIKSALDDMVSPGPAAVIRVQGQFRGGRVGGSWLPCPCLGLRNGRSGAGTLGILGLQRVPPGYGSR